MDRRHGRLADRPQALQRPARERERGLLGGYRGGPLDGPVEATLRRPVPLERALAPIVENGTARLLDGGEVIVEARRVPEFEIEVPAPVSPAEARAAMDRYLGEEEGPFSRCFVCGLGREDSFGVFSGRVEGREVVASTWTPPSWTAGGGGRTSPEFVWSALDCPTFFGAYIDVEELPLSFLGRLTARIDLLPAVGEEHVLMSWPLGIDGRKAESGVALLDAGGDVLAAARAVLIEARKGE